MEREEVDFFSWRRLSLEKLYERYDSLLKDYGIKLRPVLIEIVDVDTYWGLWDASTRTIRFAKKLLQEYSWFYVVQILGHEMAHQMVDECYGGLGGEGAHGPKFQRACEELRVWGPFRRACVDFQSTSLEVEVEEDSESAKLLDKVKKLLALATSKNEHEALLAMNKVRELYAKYHLEHQAKQPGFYHHWILLKKNRVERYESRIFSLLIEHFFVKVIYTSYWDFDASHWYQAVELIGTRENVLMADYVYHFLTHQLEYWLKDAVERSPVAFSRVARKSFRLGLLAGFSEKLQVSEQVSGAQGVLGKAMVLFQKDIALENYMNRVYPFLRSRASNTMMIDRTAFATGKEVGKTIVLKRAVQEEGGSSGKLLV